MTKNDTLYKILFAIEIALLPMVFYARIMLEAWVIGLFVAGILVCKIWRTVFKNKKSLTHRIIDCIANSLVIGTLLIAHGVFGYMNLALAIIATVLVVLAEIYNLFLSKFNIPDTIDAVDFCVLIFQFLTLIALTFVSFYDIVLQIGVFALILASLVSVTYKTYYVLRKVEWSRLFVKMSKKK